MSSWNNLGESRINWKNQPQPWPVTSVSLFSSGSPNIRLPFVPKCRGCRQERRYELTKDENLRCWPGVRVNGVIDHTYQPRRNTWWKEITHTNDLYSEYVQLSACIHLIKKNYCRCRIVGMIADFLGEIMLSGLINTYVVCGEACT